MPVISVGWDKGVARGAIVYKSRRSGDGDFEQIQDN